MNLYNERKYDGLAVNPQKNFCHEVTVSVYNVATLASVLEKLGTKHKDYRCKIFHTQTKTINGYTECIRITRYAICRFVKKDMAIKFKLMWTL